MNKKQDNLDYIKGYGKNYANLRKKEYNHTKDYTVRELSKELLIASSTISKIEKENVFPTVEQVKAYKNFFHVSLDYLTGETTYNGQMSRAYENISRGGNLMSNTELRAELKAAKIPYWKIADKLGVHENTVIRLMRHELSCEDRERINKAIAEIKKEETA